MGCQKRTSFPEFYVMMCAHWVICCIIFVCLKLYLGFSTVLAVNIRLINVNVNSVVLSKMVQNHSQFVRIFQTLHWSSFHIFCYINFNVSKQNVKEIWNMMNELFILCLDIWQRHVTFGRTYKESSQEPSSSQREAHHSADSAQACPYYGPCPCSHPHSCLWRPWVRRRRIIATSTSSSKVTHT